MSKIDIRPMVDLLEHGIDAKDLAKIMDEVLFDYAYNKIEKGENGQEQASCTNLYYLRALRDKLLEIGGCA